MMSARSVMVAVLCVLGAGAGLYGAELSVGDLAMLSDDTATVIVSGDIAGESTIGITLLVKIVTRGGNVGTVTFTPASPVDVVQLGDPWPGLGTFTPFDTDNTPSILLNGSVDDNGTFIPEPTTFSGQLTGFPIVASPGAVGVWDVVLSTLRGDSSWQSVPTTLTSGAITVFRSADPPMADPTVPDVGNGTRNRYLSFMPANPGELTALRVTLTATDLNGDPGGEPNFLYLEGDQWWITEPFLVTEASGSDQPVPPPTFWAAMAECDHPLTSEYRDWSVYDVVHVYTDKVFPDSTYEIQAIDVTCDPGEEEFEESNFSAPLVIRTSTYGDVTGDCAVTPCSPPNGTADFVDISAIVDKFLNRDGAPQKARADIIGYDATDPLPNRKVDFVDVSAAVGAFNGVPYPSPSPFPVECPE